MMMLRFWLLLLSGLFWAAPGQATATVFFDEGYENHLWTGSNGNPWSTGSCFNMIGQTGADGNPVGSGPWPDGCNPMVSTDVAHTGTHSLHGRYLPSPCPGGDVNGNCGQFIDRQHPAGTHIFTRFWHYQSNFSSNSIAGTKIFYNRSNAGDNAGSKYPLVFFIELPEVEQGNVDAQMITSQNSLCPATGNVQIGCNYYHNINSRTFTNDAIWHCIETEIDQGTAGFSDGMLNVWFDGVPTLQYTGQQFRFSGDFAYDYVRIYTQLGLGDTYLDDFAVGDTRIGCGTAPPPADTTPPNAVTGLAVTAAGAATWNGTLDNLGGSGLGGYNLLRCTGATCTASVVLASVGATATSYADTTVIAGTVYGYAINAVDNAGNISANSATVYITAAATVRTLLATYTPSGTNADLGVAWDPGYTGNAACKLVSNLILDTGPVGTGCLESYNAIATPNDQWGQIALTTLGGTLTAQAQVWLRLANAPTVSGYVCYAQINNASVKSGIGRWSAGIFTDLSTENVAPWASTDALRCEVQGTTIKLYRVFGSSESLVLTANDTTYTAGKVGLGLWVNSALTDVQLGAVTIGGFGAAAPPSITSVTNVSRTQATVAWSLATLPTNIRVFTGDVPVASVVAPLSSFPSGVYTYPPTILNKLTTYICFIAQDSGGNEIAGSQVCGSVPAAPIDTAPPVVTLSAPTSALPFGTTSTTLAVTLDKSVACRNDTVNPAGTDFLAYAGMANGMGTVSLTSSGTITGLSTGTVNYYVRCNFVDALGVNHPNPTSLTIPVTVSASTADTTRPSDVTGLSCTAISSSQVSCTWNVATDNVTVFGYQVFLSFGTGNTTYNLAGLPVTTTRIITDVPANTVVNVVVKAIDSSNNLSLNYSNVSTVTTPIIPVTSIPSTMTNLKVKASYTGSMVLTSDAGTDAIGSVTAIIELSPAGCGSFVFIYAQTSLDYLINNLAANTSYCARGRFSNGTNLSTTYSNVVQFTTAATGRGTPSAVLPFGVTRGSASRDAAGSRAVRP